MEFTLLLDSPREPRKTVQIAKLGDDFEHAKYGQFSIAPSDIDSWKRNLDNLPGRRALIDEDHSADRTPRRTEASGWITDVRLEGGTPVADIEWTPKGEQAIRDGRYLFISPTFGNFTDEHGAVHENTLIGAALTNRPFLNMPSLCLASDERVSEAIDEDPALRFHVRALDGEYGELTRSLVMLDVSQAERDRAHAAGHSLPDGSYPIENAKQLHSAAVLAASGHGDAKAAKALIRRRAKDLGVDIATLPGFAPTTADSRALSMPNEDLIKLLDLDSDADEAKLLEAITSLKASADEAAKLQKKLEKKPLKTLEQQAADNGLVLLDSTTVKQLQTQAAAGDAAMKQLHATTRENAFAKALEQRKATPAEKEDFDKLYELDSALALKMLDNRQPIVPEMPAGAPTIQLDLDADPEQVARAGLHPGMHALHSRIQKYMLDKGMGEAQYATVLDQYMKGQVAL